MRGSTRERPNSTSSSARIIIAARSGAVPLRPSNENALRKRGTDRLNTRYSGAISLIALSRSGLVVRRRLGGRRRKLGDKKRREIAGSVIPGRKSGAEMARLYDVSEPTASRIVAEYRQSERGA